MQGLPWQGKNHKDEKSADAGQERRRRYAKGQGQKGDRDKKVEFRIRGDPGHIGKLPGGDVRKEGKEHNGTQTG
ncbi:MAG: hypothetical protein HBSIN02_16010 [Bacteroidia bacterium]|nr:MAG: hypothetical protein HBSIN02_16010 [Bacteroidia bacterium]